MHVSITFLLSFLHAHSLLGAMSLLFLEESGMPIPVSDIVITYMGYEVAKHIVTFYAAFSGLLIADLLGSSVLYYLSFHFGKSFITKLGKFIDLDPDKLEYVKKEYKKYGPLVIIFGRHIPGFRVPLTIFAGMSGIPYLLFLFSTFISVFLWIMFYLYLGQKLGIRVEHIFYNHHGLSILFILLPVIILGIVMLLLKSSGNKLVVKKEKK